MEYSLHERWLQVMIIEVIFLVGIQRVIIVRPEKLINIVILAILIQLLQVRVRNSTF